MPVPDFQMLMLPALSALSGGAETPVATVRKRVADTLGLTPEDVRELLPSGGQSVFTNRVSWAVIHMARAGLVERIRRGVYQLTEAGVLLLSRKPARIDLNLLREYPSYAQRVSRSNARKPTSMLPLSEAQDPTDTDTPEEALEHAAERLNSELEAEVLQRVRDMEPMFLERVIVQLLVKMGYGGGDAAMGRVTGRSGDGGIDGTIREDPLGLDEVYIQAKKYAEGNTVGEGDLRNFAGAIDAAGTNKGVFVTTADFTRSARAYVERSPKRIVLIDGQELARYMVLHGIGVRTKSSYEVKRIDEDYFDQE